MRALDGLDEGADEILSVLFEPKAKSCVDLLNYPMRLNDDNAPPARLRPP